MATSSEPARTAAYSNDLRWKMVYQKEGLSVPYSSIASNLCVDISTVIRVVKRFRETGAVTKKPYPTEILNKKLTQVLQFFILDLVLTNPGIYLHEIQLKIQEEFYVTIDCSTICRFLHKSGFSHQRLRIVASQQNESLRATYAIDISLYHNDMLIFVDETGCDRRDLIRKKGYCIRGKPAVKHKLLLRGEHISVIAAISTKGLLDVKICRGGVDSDTFYD
uniref:Paired domain-containing protein n=1 Tax=Amphimedon queenslandica TaxID=400682 RepID=A0A1X7V458_AMPQE